MSGSPVLTVDGLGVELSTPTGHVEVLRNVSFEVGTAETLGLVGESGSGKSTTALALMGLLPSSARVRGRAALGDTHLLPSDESTARAVRGDGMAMVFQEPGQSLHPHISIGEQIAETLRHHRGLQRAAARQESVEMLRRVQIAQPELRARQYPFELSGGMQQRVMLAIALSCAPALLFADEPTTALDATIQAQMLELLRSLQTELGLSIVFISHDLALVSDFCDRVAVLYAGEIVESAETRVLVNEPLHPYTDALLTAAVGPDAQTNRLATIRGAPPRPGARPDGCAFHPRCPHVTDACTSGPVSETTPRGPTHSVRCVHAPDLELLGLAQSQRNSAAREVAAPNTASEGAPVLVAKGLRKEFSQGRTWLERRRLPPVVAVDDVDLELAPGTTLGLVGESGSGKSTTARLILRLLDPTAGSVQLSGRDVTKLRGSKLRETRTTIQAVFQDVAGSLDPTMTVGEHLAVPLRVHTATPRPERRDRATELLEAVGLTGGHLDRYPYELSGGQQQRVVLARALAADPRVIVLDEPVSSLDVSTQSQAVNLLAELQENLGLSYLLIAHDLPLVRHLSDKLAVMYLGRIVELGPSNQVYEHARHPYTQALLSSAPSLWGGRPDRIVLSGEIPGPGQIPSGCRFHTRCPYAFEPCSHIAPARLRFADGGSVECHLHDRGPVLQGESVDSWARTGVEQRVHIGSGSKSNQPNEPSTGGH